MEKLLVFLIFLIGNLKTIKMEFYHLIQPDWIKMENMYRRTHRFCVMLFAFIKDSFCSLQCPYDYAIQRIS